MIRSHENPPLFTIRLWLHDTAAIPLFFFLNLGLKSKNASAVRRQHEVNRFNTLTL